MSLVQDLDNNINLVYLSIVSQLFPHTAEDLGEGSLAQTLILKCSFIFVLKSFIGNMVECIFSESKTYSDRLQRKYMMAVPNIRQNFMIA